MKTDRVTASVRLMRKHWASADLITEDKWRAKERGEIGKAGKLLRLAAEHDGHAARAMHAAMRAVPTTRRGVFWQIAHAARLLRGADIPEIQALGEELAQLAVKYARRKADERTHTRLFFIASASLAPCACLDDNAALARQTLFRTLRAVPHGQKIH
jgi:hypothetical protein